MKVVVSGIGVVSALGIGVEANFTHLLDGKTGISLKPSVLCTGNILPVGELVMTNTQLKQSLGIDEGKCISRTALLGTLAAKEAILDSKINTETCRVGMISSTSVGGMDLSEDFFKDFLQDSNSGNLDKIRMHDCGASTLFISNYCKINSYITTISTACSSAANAIMKGYYLLKHRVLDAVVVGGCDALSAFTLNGFKSLMILDKQVCRPFDRDRAGLNLGEGAGYLVLQREEDASNFYCYLAGCGNANDAYHQTASSDNGEGAYLAMQKAISMSGISIQDINHVNAHGTGTYNNDLSESKALLRLFTNSMPLVTSTKSYTGHTLAAAGGIEAVFSILSLKNNFVPASLNIKNTMEDGIVPVLTHTKSDIKAVLSNSFGFGGNCSSLIFSK